MKIWRNLQLWILPLTQSFFWKHKINLPTEEQTGILQNRITIQLWSTLLNIKQVGLYQYFSNGWTSTPPLPILSYNKNKLFLVAELLYKSKCPSVCPPTTFRGKRDFSAPNWDIAPIFFVQISLLNEHLFCKYFVRLSVGNAAKGFATYGCCHPCYYIIPLKYYIIYFIANYNRILFNQMKDFFLSYWKTEY